MEKETSKMKEMCKKNMIYWLIIMLLSCSLLAGQIVNRLIPFALVEEYYITIVNDLQNGFIFGLFGVSIFFFVYYGMGVLKDEIAKKLYIRATDDRNKLIKEKVGVRFYLINAICLMIAIVISGYFNHIVFFTLFGVLLLQIFVALVSKIYWKTKL